MNNFRGTPTRTLGGLPTRRDFLCAAAGAAIGLTAPRLRAAERAIVATLVIPAGAAVQDGAQLGAEEARHTARLFDRTFDLTVSRVANIAEAVAATRDAAARRSSAVVGGVTGPLANAIAGAATIPFLEVRSLDDAGVPVEDGRYRLTPARAQLAAAVGNRKGARAVVWHPRLRRYGAAELNERFEENTGRQMHSDAWSGWLAMKLIVESALRDRDLAAMRIDGHKGVVLHFDAHRVLQQPLYLVTTADGEETLLDA